MVELKKILEEEIRLFLAENREKIVKRAEKKLRAEKQKASGKS